MERLMVPLIALILTVFVLGIVSAGEAVYNYFTKKVEGEGEESSTFDLVQTLLVVAVMVQVILGIAVSLQYLLR